ncbi:hypothetical protein MKX08_000393 [Trichoderma sp. CBMAI-0020]|nr:hypothetical protein MKX08_000393 [Trichoderma sp. CBMAI-0020]WOD45976.1 hypothetical protein [Trichoderma atroviride]
MPVLSWTELLGDVAVSHRSILSTSLASAGNATVPADDGLKVVCAWPVSGQYGPGSRILYYVLIAACVFARKAEWIKNACLAAALLFPAVAAVHGIVLAALHRDEAVDMDVYGAFQLCSIAILVAPMTVRLSETYFNTRGRNTIFLWAGLILAGLLSLSVEFYRIQAYSCHEDGHGNPVSNNPSKFPYGDDTTCGLRCSVKDGPSSPMRQGSANNIYVIPVPRILTFGTATLLAAGCCVHTIVWMASMTDKVFDKWMSRLRIGLGADDTPVDETISGTNGATKKSMRGVNSGIRYFLSVVAIPVFGGAGLAIIIVGEINFFSGPVYYQAEPLASIGQWAPIVGTGLAAIGSLYLVLAADVEAAKEESDAHFVQECKCSHQHIEYQNRRGSPGTDSSSTDREGQPRSSGEADSPETPESVHFPAMRHADTGFSTVSHRGLDRISTMQTGISNDASTIARHVSSGSTVHRTSTVDSGNRRKVANMLISVGNALGNKAHNWVDDYDKSGKALDFPELPGEIWKNPNLPKIRHTYNVPRDAEGNATPLPRSRSRAGSYRGASPQPVLSPSRSQSVASPSPSLPRQYRASTLPDGYPHGPLNDSPPVLPAQTRGRQRMRSDTLEVPTLSHHNPLNIHYLETATPVPAMSGGRSLPPSPSDKSDGGGDHEEPPRAIEAAVSPTVCQSQEHAGTPPPT